MKKTEKDSSSKEVFKFHLIKKNKKSTNERAGFIKKRLA
jgi:hypothetical protein